jgi:hypothetical protein
MPGGVATPRLEGSFLKTDELRHPQPTKDQKMAVAEPGLEGKKKTLYFVRQTRYLDHGWPPWEKMKGCLISTSFYTPWEAGQQVPSVPLKDHTMPQTGTNRFSKSINL